MLTCNNANINNANIIMCNAYTLNVASHTALSFPYAQRFVTPDRY